MCGIIGLASTVPLSPMSPSLITARDVMIHRGPDSHGYFDSACHRVQLGHRRLAIVDLSPSGHQPMTHGNSELSVVFNGEIYNHRELRQELIRSGTVFRSKSDTEVLLAAYAHWGDSFFSKLNGPFAFALFDKRRGRVILGRDRAGEKPLYYRSHQGVLAFASELTVLDSLVGSQKKMNPVAMVSYLSRGFTLSTDTLLDGISCVAPASYGVFDLESGSLEFKKYWVPPKYIGGSDSLSENEPLALDSTQHELEELLSDAVRLQLSCDVPTCVLLSGGVDSSLITALAIRHAPTVQTFTVCFPGFSQFDETKSARLIANYFGTKHTEIEGADISPDIFLNLVRKLDTPINDSSLIPTYLVNQEVSKVCRVAIGGDGGDELFGGYKHYSRLMSLHHLIGAGLSLLPASIGVALKNCTPDQYRWRNWFECIGRDLSKGVPNIREIFSRQEVDFISGKTESEPWEKGYHDWLTISSNHGSVLRNSSIADFFGYFSNSILVKSDRMSMLNSVEARAPFLDSRVIDFAFNRVPDSMKTSPKSRKIILKRICRRLLPEEFDLNRKLGFNLPLGDLIRSGKWRELFQDIIHSEYTFLNRSACIRVFDEHLEGKNHADKLFGLALLIQWTKENKIPGYV